MSIQTIFEHEIEFYNKKCKWKKCYCIIQIISRLKVTLCAIVRDSENNKVIDIIDIYGYECGINNVEFVFIGKKDCFFIRFKDIEKMMELEKILKKYIKDVSYFIELESCKKENSILIPKEWYRFHVQLNRICLTTDVSKGNELIKVWNIFRVGEVNLNDCSLSVEIKNGKDNGVYTFYHDNKVVLHDIYNAILERKLEVPFFQMEQYNLTKRRSECVDLKRFNSCSNSREMKQNHRIRTLSSSVTEKSDYDVSMPSTPSYNLTNSYETNLSSRYHVNISEDVEPPLIFQMDTLDMADTNGVYELDRRSKTNSESYHSISTDSGFKSHRTVGLERFPFEAETKHKANTSPSINVKDYQPDNMDIISRPNNGKFYQTLSSLKNGKTISDVNLNDNAKRLPTEMDLSPSTEKTEKYEKPIRIYSENKSSSSSFIHTPSSSSCENQSIPVPKYKTDLHLSTNRQILKENGHSFPNHTYYNLSNHMISHGSQGNSHNSHQYFNIVHSMQSNPEDIKSLKNEDNHLNYIQLDFRDFPESNSSKFNINSVHESNYKEIDIKHTEALKSLDDFSLPKTQKKGLLRYWFKK